MYLMKFEWNESKNKLNFKKHSITFEDAKVVFDSPLLTLLDNREDYGEDRWIGIGMIKSIVIVVTFTERNDDTIRIISARKATRNEKENYFKKI